MEILRQNNNVLSGEMLSYEMVSRIKEDVTDPDRATPAFSELQNSGHVAGDFYFVPTEQPLLVANTYNGEGSI